MSKLLFIILALRTAISTYERTMFVPGNKTELHKLEEQVDETKAKKNTDNSEPINPFDPS